MAKRVHISTVTFPSPELRDFFATSESAGMDGRLLEERRERTRRVEILDGRERYGVQDICINLKAV